MKQTIQNNQHYVKIAAAVAAGLFFFFNIKGIIIATVLVGGIYYIVQRYRSYTAAPAM